jgi:V/A-type H+-transporting ATPase subunit D
MESQLTSAHRGFVFARAVMRPEAVEEALMMGRAPLTVDLDTLNIMSVEVPVFLLPPDESGRSDTPSYGLASTSGDLDSAVSALQGAFGGMLALAESEKAAQLLADEIEKTRRRVNSLEYILIPSLVETIHSITAKLEENERGALTRLMKVKDRLVEKAILERQARDAR